MDQIFDLRGNEILDIRRIQIDTIVTPNHGKILLVDDIDGRKIPVVIPKMPTQQSVAILDSLNKDNWQEKVVMPDPVKIQRFNYCIYTLGMPKEHAAYLAFGSDESLKNYPEPDQKPKQIFTISVRGESSPEKGGAGVGKSTIAAVLGARLSEKHSVKVFDFECLYREGAGLYSDELKRNGWESGYKEAVSIIAGLWEKKTKQPNAKMKSLRQIIEGKDTGQGLEFFRYTTDRPEIIIYDMVGEPRKTHDVNGKEIITGRPYEARDLFGLGMDYISYTKRKVLVESEKTGYRPMDAKMDWMVNEIEEKLKK